MCGVIVWNITFQRTVMLPVTLTGTHIYRSYKLLSLYMNLSKDGLGGRWENIEHHLIRRAQVSPACPFGKRSIRSQSV